jgi:hypothetical protein
VASAVTIQETAKSLTCPELGTRYRALRVDKKTSRQTAPAPSQSDFVGRRCAAGSLICLSRLHAISMASAGSAETKSRGNELEII